MIETIDKTKMEALEELAKTNVLIGEAKGILIKIQTEQETYIEEREKKTLERIDNLLKESEETINKIGQNYQQIQDFNNEILIYVKFLNETYNKLDRIIKNFNERSEKYEEYIKNQDERLSKIKQDIQIKEKQTIIERTLIDKRNKDLSNWQTKLNSQQEALKVAIKIINKKKYDR